MLLSTTAPLADHYLLTRLLAITHLHFASTPANLSLVPWYRIRGEGGLHHGRGSIKRGGRRKERKERRPKS
jgi:hypothetical protein